MRHAQGDSCFQGGESAQRGKGDRGGDDAHGGEHGWEKAKYVHIVKQTLVPKDVV